MKKSEAEKIRTKYGKYPNRLCATQYLIGVPENALAYCNGCKYHLDKSFRQYGTWVYTCIFDDYLYGAIV